SMKISSLASVAFLAIVTTVVAQESAKELPSAPSAVKQTQSQPSAPPVVPADTKPVETTPANNPPAQTGNASGGSILETPAYSLNNIADVPEARFVLKVNDVNVVFTVTHGHGRLIKDLNREDFKVVDDGRRDTRIPDFQKEPNLPLRVGLLVDASNSV